MKNSLKTKDMALIVRWSAGLLAICAAIAPLIAAASPACAPRKSGTFRIYHSLVYADMPDLQRWGVRPTHLVDRDFWRGSGNSREGDPTAIAKIAARLPSDGAPIVMDIEDLPVGAKDSAAPRNVAVLADLIRQFRAAAPGHSIGFYGLIPTIDYWRTRDVPAGGFRDWQQDNEITRSLEHNVDLIFPSAYTFYKDQSAWAESAIAQICEARRLSKKPVLLFLWPEYHDSTPYAGQPVEPGYWAYELDIAHRYADGIVIFGGYDLQNDRAYRWDDPVWWSVTKRSMSTWRDFR